VILKAKTCPPLAQCNTHCTACIKPWSSAEGDPAWDGIIEWLPVLARCHTSIPVQLRMPQPILRSAACRATGWNRAPEWLTIRASNDCGAAVGELSYPPGPTFAIGPGPGAYLVVDLMRWSTGDGRDAQVVCSCRGWPQNVGTFIRTCMELWDASP
jgi:hypothetical protein